MERASSSGTRDSVPTRARARCGPNPPPLRPEDVVAAAPFLDSLPYPAMWIEPDYRIAWQNCAANVVYGTSSRPCFLTLHGYDAPCAEKGERCPLGDGANGVIHPGPLSHVHRSRKGPELYLISPHHVESGGVIEFHVPLGDDLIRDSLTGLYSRTVFEQLSRMQLQLLRRLRQGYSVILADLDQLKRINDRFGHPVGDAAIRAVARAVAGNVRAADCAGRWGGDEFCILLPSATRPDAIRLVRRVSRALEETVIEGTDGEPPRVSFGVASCRRSYDLDRAIARADRSLYRAKAAASRRKVQGPGMPPRS